jgi:hypothetical protein
VDDLKLNVQSEKELNRIITGFTTSDGLKSIDDRRRPERHQLGMYLALLRKNKGKGIFPMVVEELSPKNDPPDYIIKLPKKMTIGLEVTEATDQEYRKEEHLKNINSDSLENASGEEDRGKANRSLVYKRNADAIFDAITRKTKILERIRLKKCSVNHLGIWPNMPQAIWLNSEKALNIVERHLTETLNGELFSGFFDRIFILQNPGERQYLFCFERFKYTYRAIPLRSAFNT